MKEVLGRKAGGQWGRRLFSTAFMIIVIFIFSASSWAAVPDRVKVTLTQGSTGKTNINLTWNWIIGNQFSRSVDGETWSTPLTGAGTIPSAGTLSINGGIASYTENDFTNWNIVYFKLSDGTNSKRINVYPPIEHGHSNYSDNTDQCKVCHITHTATNTKLLSNTSIQALCYTCHGGSIATGSRYNVEKGTTLYSGDIDWSGDKKIKTSSPIPLFRKSLGGPFSALATDAQWGLKATSSSHEIQGPLKQAPGGSQNWSLTCTDCHNSHASNENYRLLNINSVAVDAYAKINPLALEDTDFREQATFYKNGMNQFCKSCHPQFQKGAGSGHTTTDAVYRHATEVPLEWDAPTGHVIYTSTLPLYKDTDDSNKPKIFCLTCHFAHGTVAQGNNNSINVPSPGGSTVLKRLDNMAVCEDCHKK